MNAPFLLALAYVGLVYIRPQEYVEALAAFPVMPIVLVAAFAAWLPRAGKSFEAPQHKLLPVLFFFMCFSVAVNGWAGGAVKVASEFGPTVVLFYLLATTMDKAERHETFMGALALFTVFLSAHGIDQSMKGIGWSGAELSQGTRITYLGIFNDPNDLAAAFVIGLPMLAYRLHRAGGFLGRLFWFSAMGTTIYAIYLTNSRGGLLAAASQGFVFLWRRYGIWKAGFAALPGLVVLAMLPSRLSEIDADEASAAGRVDSWYQGVLMLQSHPVFGVGKGNYVEHHPLTAHNSIVLVFAELGVTGYYVWLSFVALSFFMVLRIVRRPPGGPRAPAEAECPQWPRVYTIAQTYWYAAIGFFVAAFFLSRSYNVLLFMLCAACVAAFQLARAAWPGLPPVRFAQWAVPLAGLEILTIVGMFLVVKVLL